MFRGMKLADDAICEVCGKLLAQRGDNTDKNKFAIRVENLYVRNSDNEIIFRGYGKTHYFCFEHAQKDILTVIKPYVTLSQLADCLSLQNWDSVKVGSLRYIWIKRILKNCLEGMQ